MWVVWLLAALVLLGLEVHTQAFYALLLALGAFVATLVALLATPVWLQAVIGVGVALLGTFLVRPTLARIAAKHLGPPLRLPGASSNLIGQPALALEPIGDANHPGHARLFNERWLASAGSTQPIPAHTSVTVVAVLGTTLVVIPSPAA
jgi:membrane protein implicated in regulation of membrane protease activity